MVLVGGIQTVMGPLAGAYGVAENRAMIETFCTEQRAQELVKTPIAPESVFVAFESLP